jgi:MHS family proline/betaine transporter-like MFS transporter
MMSSSVATPPLVSPKVLRNVTIGASVGSIVEFYDVAIYAYLASVIGRVFFAASDPVVALLSSFAVFGAAFVVRPLGGLFFGMMGDRIGRQKTLAAIIILISAATLGIGLIPSYATIGVMAPILLVFLRLVQGFSAGGEVGGATAFVAEYARATRRGRSVSLVELGAMSGFLFGSLVALILNFTLGPDQVFQWGWRIAFLIAAPMGIVGFVIRYRLEETPEFAALQVSGKVLKRPLRATVTQHWRAVLIVAAFSLFQNVAVYVILTFVSSYLSTTMGYGPNLASLSSVLALVVLNLVIPFSGALSDRIGRKSILAASCGAMIVLGYPLFLLMDQGVGFAILAHVVLGFLLGIFLGPVLTAMSELFPTEVRFGGVSLGYNISVSLFGGTAPFIVTLLIATTGIKASPSFYIIAAALVTLIVIAFTRETAPLVLARRDSLRGKAKQEPSSGIEQL